MNVVEAGPAIRVQAEVTRQIRQHARGSMNAEVCGVLIGDVREGSAEHGVEIFAAIAGVNAAQAGTHVTFTQDAWEHIYKVKDAEYPEARIVGWYHSHPGFGVFLSEHDTFIQENFFSAVSQVAWVFDPHTDEEGCFGWIDGKIGRLESITVADSNSPVKVSESRELAAPAEVEESEAAPKRRRMRVGAPPRWLRWAGSVSALLVMMVLGFVIGRLFFPTLYPLVLPMNPQNGQPLLRDPKTGQPVYMDPQTNKYVMPDQWGRLTTVDPGALKPTQPPAESNPFMPSPGAGSPETVVPAPPPNTALPKEKK
jgi:proteasome lid subunit RPN8/RPN11